MQLIKVGNDYFNLDFLIKAAVTPTGTVTLVFTDGKSAQTTIEEWEALLVNLQIDYPEIEKFRSQP